MKQQCSVCWDDLASSASRERAINVGVPDDELPGERCWWRTANNQEWQFSKYCFACVERAKNENYTNYIENVKNATCPKQLRNLIEAGPPVYIIDSTTFPVQEGDYVSEFRRIRPNGEEEIVSARLVGSVTGEERDRVWQELQGIAYEVGKKLIQKMSPIENSNN